MQKDIDGESGLKYPIYWKYLVSEILKNQEDRIMYQLNSSPEKKRNKNLKSSLEMYKLMETFDLRAS